MAVGLCCSCGGPAPLSGDSARRHQAPKVRPAPVTSPARSTTAGPANPAVGTPTKSDPPDGFVDLQTLAGVRLEVRYATDNNFTGAALPGYAVAGAWLRDAPATALGQVARARGQEADSLELCVFDGYRPRRATAAMVDWAGRTGNAHLVEAGYIAARSRHNEGMAVDLTLCDERGRALDMGGAYDAFAPVSHFARATGTAMKNRRRLRVAMRAQGFEPYSKEWWHFSWPEPGRSLDVPYGTMSTWNHHQSMP